MHDTLSRLALGVAVLLIAAAGDVEAQSVDVGGRAYIDYFYTLSSPDDDAEGFHGFTYRRLYLTADATLSEDFRARARLEANDGTTGAKGPVPFVKDLWIAWNYNGGHSAMLGVMPPPVFELAEDVWDYRSLEKTILDFQDVNDSRDFGIRFHGPLASDGVVRYAVMLANNNAASPETDKFKRGYAQLSLHPTEELVFSAGAHHEGFGDAREEGTRLSAFGGYMAGTARFGVEAFWYLLEFTNGDEFRNRGVSLFGSVRLDPRWEVVGRVDLSTEDAGMESLDETFILAGVAYAPVENVRIIPNLWLFDAEAVNDTEALGRVTVDVNF